jgi:tripartite motif-containing protein 71
MSTTMDPVEAEQPTPPPEEDEDRSSRKMLIFLLVVLGLAVIGLLVLLLWLLWPGATTPEGQAAGYPIEVKTTIYGYGDGPEELLLRPLGVAWDDQGNVWISNSGRARVEQYTADGNYIRTVGDQDPGKLLSPYGVAVDPARDRVYVADVAARMLQIYTASTGGYVGHFPSDEVDTRIFGPDGFTPFHVEVGGGRVIASSNDGLYFFDQNGQVVGRWGGWIKKKGTAGPGLGMFQFPDSFVVDPVTGRTYVADTMNRRVVALDRNGKWLWSAGTSDEEGKIVSFWQLPRGIELGADGNIYVVDTFRPDETGMGTGYLVVLSPDGDLLSEFGRTGADDGAFRYPDQLSFDGNELWAIADRENDRVVIFRLLTPYPPVDDMFSDRYPKTFVDLSDAVITSTPAPPTP